MVQPSAFRGQFCRPWALACLFFAGIGSSQSVYAQSSRLIENAKREFEHTCIHCHRPPDLAFGTDRAWLDQIKLTS